MPMIEEIDVTELQTRLASDENIRLIDVRTQAEWDQGIIEGGEFMPVDTVPAHLNDFSNDVTNIIYCRSGIRSAQACMFLEEHAGIKAINVKGGIIAWHHAGGAIIRP